MNFELLALLIFLFPLAFSPGPGNMLFAANGLERLNNFSHCHRDLCAGVWVRQSGHHDANRAEGDSGDRRNVARLAR